MTFDGRIFIPAFAALLWWLVRELSPRRILTMSELSAHPKHYRRLVEWGERHDAQAVRDRIDERRARIAQERTR